MLVERSVLTKIIFIYGRTGGVGGTLKVGLIGGRQEAAEGV
jgi:hypothetical protein